MIGEQFWGHAEPGARIGRALPAGASMVAVRVNAPCRLSLLLNGREAASTKVTGTVADGEMPGSGYSLLVSLAGEREVSVEADAAVDVWGVIE